MITKIRILFYYVKTKGVFNTLNLVFNRYLYLFKWIIYQKYYILIKNFFATERKKIIIVTHNCSRTGAPFVALNIGKTLTEVYSFDVMFISFNGGGLVSEFKNCGTLMILHKQENLVKFSKNEELIFKYIEKYQNNLQGFICNSVVSASILPYIRNIDTQYINIVHELPNTILKKNYKKHAQLILKYSKHIVFPTKYVQSAFIEMLSLDKNKIYSIPQGVNLVSDNITQERALQICFDQYNLDKNAKIILGCGADFYRKGVDYFVEVAILLINTNENVHFVWIGDKDYPFFEKIEKKILNNNLSKKVHFIGAIKNPYSLFKRADIFLMTSRVDPFPTVVLDAMNAETVVIAFKKSGGIYEVLENNTGVIVDEFSPVAMKNECLDILYDEKRKKMLVKKAKEIVTTEYNYRVYVKKLLDILKIGGL